MATLLDIRPKETQQELEACLTLHRSCCTSTCRPTCIANKLTEHIPALSALLAVPKLDPYERLLWTLVAQAAQYGPGDLTSGKASLAPARQAIVRVLGQIEESLCKSKTPPTEAAQPRTVHIQG